MSVGLLTEDECRKALWERLSSGEFWTIPWVSEPATYLCNHLEERYCSDEDAANFEIFMVPGSGVFAVGFVRKSGLPAPDLADVLLALEIFPPAETSKADLVRSLKEQDILVLVDAREKSARKASYRALHAWQRWMGKCPDS